MDTHFSHTFPLREEVCVQCVRVWESFLCQKAYQDRSVTGPSCGAGSGTGCGGRTQRERGVASLLPRLKDLLYVGAGEWSHCPRWGDEQVSVVIMGKGEHSLSLGLPICLTFLLSIFLFREMCTSSYGYLNVDILYMSYCNEPLAPLLNHWPVFDFKCLTRTLLATYCILCIVCLGWSVFQLYKVPNHCDAPDPCHNLDFF